MGEDGGASPAIIFVVSLSRRKQAFARDRTTTKNAATFVAASSPDVLCTGDSCGIQTHNLLIRSQMLYSVELRSLYVLLGSGSRCLSIELLLLDTGLLACQSTEVEDTCASYLAVLVDFDVLDER